MYDDEYDEKLNALMLYEYAFIQIVCSTDGHINVFFVFFFHFHAASVEF